MHDQMNNAKKITIIIPFANEGCEVENTLMSIFEHSDNNVNIIVINDASDDGFDYNNISTLGTLHKNPYASVTSGGAVLTDTMAAMQIDPGDGSDYRGEKSLIFSSNYHFSTHAWNVL